MLNAFLYLISGAIGPFLLWPVEYYLPYPAVVEEIFKFLALYWLARSSFQKNSIISKNGVVLATLFGLFFTITESMLYLMNIALLNQFSLFPYRLLVTGLLHISTTLIILIGVQKKWYLKLVFISLAIGIHAVFNMYVSAPT